MVLFVPTAAPDLPDPVEGLQVLLLLLEQAVDHGQLGERDAISRRGVSQPPLAAAAASPRGRASELDAVCRRRLHDEEVVEGAGAGGGGGLGEALAARVGHAGTWNRKDTGIN